MRGHIPNTITSLNLLCGVLGVIFACDSRFDIAFFLMLGAAVADFLDGLSARLLHAYSDKGKELDSLADVVSFGVLPAVMLVQFMRISTFSDSVFCYVPALLAVCTGLRLAAFNVDERQHDSFLGLPAPASALLCGALCYFMVHENGNFLAVWACGYVFLPLFALALGALMLCELPMFSFKFGKGDSKVTVRKRLAFVLNVLIAAVIVAALGLDWSLVIVLAIVIYILMNAAFAAAKI